VSLAVVSKKILVFSPIFFPDIGGPAIQGKFLAETLSDNGFQVFVIRFSRSDYISLKFNIISLNWAPNPSIFQRMYRWFIGPVITLYYVLKIRPKLVIVNSVFWNGMIVGLICKTLKIPTILKFAGDWVFESLNGHKNQTVDFQEIYESGYFTRFLYFIQKFLMNKFTVIWVISNFRKSNVLKLAKSPKIWIQRNFHELPQIKETSSRRFTQPLIFVTSARLIPHKRIDVLIKTFSKLNYQCKFIIIGEGPELEKLSLLADTLGLSKRVFFLGKISSELLYEIYSYSSVYLSWSAEEGAPNSFIEALNFGLPIITANVGGIPEMFEFNFDSVRLIDPDNPNQLLEALLSLHSNKNDLETMSKAAFAEGKKFLRSENEAKVINFINETMNSN
jgi:glycosyltransferase involved in cell wall biosynthesis